MKWRRLTVLLLPLVALAVVVSTRPDAQPVGELQLGLVAGSEVPRQAREASQLGARIVRVEFPIEESPRQMASVIGAYARAGVTVLPLAGFEGRIPPRGEAEHLASWAAAFGQGGSYWRNHPGGESAIHDIEFGNETSYGYQFGGCGPGCPSYMARARAYALAFVDAHRAIVGVRGDARVGLLAQADYGGDGDEWVNGMFDAVPDLAKLVAGWTDHPYGPRSWWQQSLDDVVGQTAARGAPASIPIYVTEMGIASDNGSCLTENYGWSRCMTYAQAAQALISTVGEIRQRYGSRIHSIFLYQLADQRPPDYSDDREDYFGVLRADGAPKQTFTAAVRALLRANP